MSVREVRSHARVAAHAFSKRRGAPLVLPPQPPRKEMAPPFRLASRQTHPATSVVIAGGVRIGAGRLVVMAGPCSVESRQQIRETAHNRSICRALPR